VIPWLIVAAAGFVLCAWGLANLVGRYRRGLVSLRYTLAVIVAVLSGSIYVVADALRSDLVTGAASLILLFPAAVALVVVIRERPSP